MEDTYLHRGDLPDRSFEEAIELTDIDMGFAEKIELIGFDEDGTEHLMDTWHNPLDQN